MVRIQLANSRLANWTNHQRDEMALGLAHLMIEIIHSLISSTRMKKTMLFIKWKNKLKLQNADLKVAICLAENS